ncbi:MAG: DsbA family protein [Boseongicola sp.]|nr:DsbA family protein [Boseongicola sp.]
MNRIKSALAATTLALLAALFVTSQSAMAQDADSVDTSDIPEMVLGNRDADVTVVEYASFTCPHCASFHAGAFKDLKKDFIDTGKIKFVYREVFFDRQGLWAAIVARCGEGAENRYFGIADMIYENQRAWARQEDPAAIVESLRRFGKTAGLTDAQLDQCFTDADAAQKLYARYLQQAEEDGVTSTPTFIIDGTRHSNMTYSEMADLINAALGE